MISSLASVYAGTSSLGLLVRVTDDHAARILSQLISAALADAPNYPNLATHPQVAILTESDAASLDWRLLALLQGFPSISIRESEGQAARADDAQTEERTAEIRPHARFITRRASFFNYLAPAAIEKSLGVRVEVTDTSDVPANVARMLLPEGADWDSLGSEEQVRQIEAAKERLSREAATRMTIDLVRERKAKAEMLRWLYAAKLRLPRQFFN